MLVDGSFPVLCLTLTAPHTQSEIIIMITIIIIIITIVIIIIIIIIITTIGHYVSDSQCDRCR